MDSEKKLISVDDLKAKIEITDTDVCADYGDGFCQHGYSNQLLRLMINELPTVDAVEVVHGEWEISRVDPTTNYIQRWRCTVCNKDSKDEYDYCPHCGADMRRRKKDEM